MPPTLVQPSTKELERQSSRMIGTGPRGEFPVMSGKSLGRRRERELPLMDEALSAGEDPTEAVLVWDLVNERCKLAGLTQEERLVIVLREIHQHTDEELAQILGRSREKVLHLRHKASQKLREFSQTIQRALDC